MVQFVRDSVLPSKALGEQVDVCVRECNQKPALEMSSTKLFKFSGTECLNEDKNQ